MGIIHQKVKVCGIKGCIEENALFDTGSSRTLLHKDVADKIGVEYTNFKENIQVGDSSKMEFKEALIEEIHLLGYKRPKPKIFVSEKIPKRIVVGVDIMQELGLQIDMHKDKIRVRKFEPEILFL